MKKEDFEKDIIPCVCGILLDLAPVRANLPEITLPDGTIAKKPIDAVRCMECGNIMLMNN